MMMKRNNVSLCLLASLAATMFLTPGAYGSNKHDILKLVPQDVWGFAVISSLDSVDKKTSMLSGLLDLNLPTPATAMVLGPLQLGDSVDMKRPLGVLMLNAQQFGVGNIQGAVVMLLPARDPKAMLEKLNAEDPVEGVSKCMIMGQESYVAIKGKYVIAGQSQDSVTKVVRSKKALGDTFDKARLSALARSDIYISISISKLFDAYGSMFMPMVQMMTAATDPEGKRIEQLSKVLKEISAVDVALGLDKEGIALRLLAAPVKGSDIEKMMKETKNVNESLLSVLPLEKYLIAYGGTIAYSESAAAFGGQNMFSTMLKMSQVEGVDEKVIKTIDELLVDMTKSTKSWAMSLSSLKSGNDGGLFGMTFAVETDDSQQFIKRARKLYDAIWKFSDDEDFVSIKKNVAHVKDAEKIAGVKVDTITINIKALSNQFEMDEEALKPFQQILGEAIVFRLAAVGEHHFVCVYGGGKERFAKVCHSITSKGNGSLNEDNDISLAAKRLPSPHSSEGYIAVDHLVEAVKTVAKIIGDEDEIPFNLPTLHAPISFGGAQIGNIAEADLFVPMKVITAVKKSINDQMAAEMKDFDEDEDADEDNDADDDKEHDDEHEDD